MDQKIRFLVLAAGLLCLNLIPICWADDPVEDVLQEDLDVEDELDPGFVGAEEDEELEGDLQDEAPPTPKTPPVPKVRLKLSRWTVARLHQPVLSRIHLLWHHLSFPDPGRADPGQARLLVFRNRRRHRAVAPPTSSWGPVTCNTIFSCVPGDLQGSGTDGGTLHGRVLRPGDAGRVSSAVGEVT